MRYTRKYPRALLSSDQAVRVFGRSVLGFMSEDLCEVFLVEDGYPEELVARGIGRIEVDLASSGGLVHVRSEGRVWVDRLAASQHVEDVPPSKFTTLDRPPPLSPEMRYMQRLMRQNAIERERFLNEMREVQVAPGKAPAVAPKAKGKVNDGNKGGDTRPVASGVSDGSQGAADVEGVGATDPAPKPAGATAKAGSAS